MKSLRWLKKRLEVLENSFDLEGNRAIKVSSNPIKGLAPLISIIIQGALGANIFDNNHMFLAFLYSQTNISYMQWGKITVLILICLVFLIPVTSAGEGKRLTYGQRLVSSTDVYGDIVTWYETSGNGIHIYNTAIGKELQFPYNKYSTYVASNMPIYGKTVAWSDDVNVTVYNISTGSITAIPNGAHPDIYKKSIAYIHNDVLYLYNITNNKTMQIMNSSQPIYQPVINENKIAWATTAGIYLYNIKTHQISEISNIGNAIIDFYGDVITWASNGDIYTYNISTNKTSRITNTGKADSPSIYRDKIVFENDGNIYLFNVTTGFTKIIVSDMCAWSPAIFEDEIVYVDSVAAGEKNIEAGDIYLQKI
jgi:hypothetical protein